MRLLIFGIIRLVYPPIVLSVSVIIKARLTRLITFGRWVTRVLVVLVPKCSMITVPTLKAVYPVRQKRMVIAISRFGTAYLCSLIAKKTVLCYPCLPQVSIPVWVLSVLVPSCKASIVIMRSIYSFILWIQQPLFWLSPMNNKPH